MEPARLYESPFTDICPTGPDRIFTAVQLDTLIGILEGVKAAAGSMSVTMRVSPLLADEKCESEQSVKRLRIGTRVGALTIRLKAG